MMAVPAGVAAPAIIGVRSSAARKTAAIQGTIDRLSIVMPMSRFSFPSLLLLPVSLRIVAVPPSFSSFLFRICILSVPSLFMTGLLDQDLETHAARATRQHRLDQFPLDVGGHVGGGDVVDLGATGL